MKEWIDKKVIIVIDSNSKDLTYTALIKDVTEQHITFEDKYGLNFTYKISDIKQINEIKSSEIKEEKK